MVKGRSKKMCGLGGACKSNKRCLLIAILFATYCSMGTLVRGKKTWRYSARKVMEFGQLMAYILIHVSCKIEMYIFEIAQVIGENVPIAFLYVQSILFV